MRSADPRRLRDPRRGPRVRRADRPVRHPRHRARARRLGHRGARASTPTPTSSGTTGSATSTRTCSRTARSRAPSTARRVIITGASSGIGKAAAHEDRRGRRHPDARRPQHRQARGDQARDRGRRRHRLRPTPPTCPTWTRSRRSWTRSSPTTPPSTCSSTTPGARSAARSRSALDRFHDYERTMQLNYFGAIKMVMALLPHMQERRFGHIVNVSSIGAQTNPPRFSAYVASKAALDAWTRVVGQRADRRRDHLHHDPHAARAHADDRADEDLRLVPDDHARRGRRPHLRGDPRQAQDRSTLGWARSARWPTRWRPRPSTRSCTWPTRCSPTPPRPRASRPKDERASTEQVALAHLMRGVHW